MFGINVAAAILYGRALRQKREAEEKPESIPILSVEAEVLTTRVRWPEGTDPEFIRAYEARTLKETV